MTQATKLREERRIRAARLGFRVDAETKALVEHAAELERRNLTDFCLSALTEAARQTIARHETLTLSERDRAVFFDTLIHQAGPSPRLRRAFEAARRRIQP